MEHHERIEAKVGILFQIADQYLSGQIPLEKAKELVGFEMVHIRPAQFEAMKAELAIRLKEADQFKSEKLFELFKQYMPLPFDRLQNGHPLRNYYEENSRVRFYLLKIDQMEGEDVPLLEWIEIYALLSEFRIHIKRQDKNFYPLLSPKCMRLQVEKARELGNAINHEIVKNQERLKNGDIIDFLYNQRSLSQILMNYLDLEERVLYPKALASFTDQDFTNLRSADDNDGYVFIERPENFTPKAPGARKEAPELTLPALLSAKEMGIIYYTPSGEVISIMGNQMDEADLQIPEETRRRLLDGSEKQIKYWYNHEDQTFLITYGIIADSLGQCLGLLKAKENISGIKEFQGQSTESKAQENEMASGTSTPKENREINSSQNIAELFQMYPKFQEDFYRLDEELKGLKGPFGMEILRESTVGMLAKSLRIDAGGLLARINSLLKSY